jgi:hypothetical protein
LDVVRFFKAIAEIIAAREGVSITVKEIKKAADEADTGGNAKGHLEQVAV